MDPNLFHIDWERTLEALVGIIILAFIVERVSALLFESRFFIRNTKLPTPGSKDAERERADIDVAMLIIEHKDAKLLEKIVAELGPSHPLYPPYPKAPADSSDPSETVPKNPNLPLVKQAREFVEKTRTLNGRRQQLSKAPIKEIGAFVLAAAICILWDFDAVSIIILSRDTGILGELFTGALIAGGSKASIKLFRDILGVRSQAFRDMREKPKEDGE